MSLSSPGDFLEAHSFALSHGIDPTTRTIYLTGAIDEVMATHFLIGFRLIDSTEGPIRIVLLSGGGGESVGFALYDVICLAQNHVTIDCFGYVQSIAALILQAADWRRLSPECRFMFHVGSIEAEGRIDQRTLGAIAAESDFLTHRYKTILQERSHQLPSSIENWCNEEFYFSSLEAVLRGFADELITKESLHLPKPKHRRHPSPKSGEITLEIIDDLADRIKKRHEHQGKKRKR